MLADCILWKWRAYSLRFLLHHTAKLGDLIVNHKKIAFFWNPIFQFFQKSFWIFCFPWYRMWLTSRKVIIFLLTQRASLSGPLKYIKYGRMAHRKFFRGSRRKSLIPKLRSRPACLNLIFNFDFSKSEFFLLFLP